jgi:hypothetical protein
MKKRTTIVRLLLCFVLIVGLATTAGADTILFPAFVSNPGVVSTIVSVTNQGPSSACLTYSYIYKLATASSSSGCSRVEKTVNTYAGDLVSFDVSGTIGSGQAIFNDPDVYTNTFNIPTSSIVRGFLLVSNTDCSGTRVDVGSDYSLRGEAIIMDIVSGSAWGYKAINDVTREDYAFLEVSEGGDLYNVQPSGSSSRFSFGPLNTWTTKFFITPLYSNMWWGGVTSTLRLYQPNPMINGIRGRGTDTYTFNVPVTVYCHAAVNITDLLDSTAQSNLASTGGWGRLSIDAGGTAAIYKLEYTLVLRMCRQGHLTTTACG